MSAGPNNYMNFFRNVFILEQLARNRMERAFPRGMKVSHFTALSHLVNLGAGTSPAEMASAFQVTRPTMTNTLQKLEAKNYIRVDSDPNDGRGKIVRITEEGRAIFLSAVQALGEMFEDVAKNLGEQPFIAALEPLEEIRKFMDSHK